MYRANDEEATVVIHGNRVPLTGKEARLIASSPKFLNWVANLSPRLEFRHIQVESAVIIGNEPNRRLLFAFLNCTVFKDNVQLPGMVFLRGGAVAILPIIKVGRSHYTVLAVQPRVPVGSAGLVEAIAGMLDDSTGDFTGVAAKELREESGISIKANDLIPLGSFYPSAGGCDEALAVFAVELNMSRQELMVLEGKLTGELAEGESIALKVCPLSQVPVVAAQDAKALLAYFWYQEYQQRRKR